MLDITAAPPENSRPLCIGVVGDSGSGKNTLIRGIKALFGDENVTDICLDDYHRYDRQQRLELGLTALNPAANNLWLMAKHLLRVKSGQPFVKPVYDHTTGTFGTPELVFPRPVVLAHGLFTLYSPQFSHFFDLGIYLDPQPELRLNWKIMRDINSRGYTISQVLQQLEDRQADAATYIEPQKVNAGLVIRFSLPRTPGGAFDLRIESKTLLLPNRFINTPYLSVSSNNGSGQIIEISGDIDHNTAQEIAGLLGFGDKNLLGRVGLYQQANEKAHSYTLALAQLISVSAIPGASTGHLPHVA